ncbi:MAG: dienelactone hydrolase family protein, partial [Nitrospinaceae bacterium]|nr:dienelactone hydrolase family protein [Nitrospinaceae bacterium]
MSYRIEMTEVKGSPMEVFLFEPEGAGPHPGLVLCQHIPGHQGIEQDPFTIKTAERFAENGFAVSIPFLYHWWPKEDAMDAKRDEFNDAQTAPDLLKGFEVLSALDSVDSERIGIVGHCWGGRVSWLGACTNPLYKACAVFYGGGVKEVRGEGNPPAVELTAKIPCPLVGFFGNNDKNPSPEDVNDYEAALKNAGVDYVFHRYDGAGHAFQWEDNADRYGASASDDAWVKVVDFFN